jgi:beta-glucosidase-like glycosyl hydrolase
VPRGCALHRADVEEIALKDLGAERAQRLGAVVDGADKGAHGNAALEQHFGDVPAGLALAAAGCGGDEYGFGHG